MKVKNLAEGNKEYHKRYEIFIDVYRYLLQQYYISFIYMLLKTRFILTELGFIHIITMLWYTKK